MAEQLLHAPHIGPRIEQMGSKRVTQNMGRQAGIQPGLRQIPFELPLDRERREPATDAPN